MASGYLIEMEIDGGDLIPLERTYETYSRIANFPEEL